MNALLRYVRLWLSLARNCFLRQSEYKANLWGRMLLEVVWLSTQIVFFQAAFRFIPSLAGWSEGEIWFFVGSLFFVDGLMMCFFNDNQEKFGQVIRLGLFDFYLLYPVSSLFMANLRFVNVISLINVSMAIGVVAWASTFAEINLSLLNWTAWMVYCVAGAILVGLLGILVSSLAFWTTQTSNLMWLLYELYRLGHRPESLYAPWLRRLLYSAFPAAFFISVPVQLALEKKGGPWYFFPFLILALGSLACSIIWRRGVRIYEGALS